MMHTIHPASPRGERLRLSMRSAISVALLATVLFGGTALAQEPTFSVEDYAAFLAEHPEVSADELLGMHPAGVFARQASADFDRSLYADSVDHYYNLSAYEKGLIDRHGFVVTERIQPNSFGAGFVEIYKRDLPVFVSTDAILHALHMSYDLILRQTESDILIPRLRALLRGLHGELPTMAARNGYAASMQINLEDLDLYFSVARSLLEGTPVATLYPGSLEKRDELLGFVAAEQGDVQYKLFADTCRILDFSQFTTRGHYTLSEELSRYFKAMMWLGRTELYLIGPVTAICEPTDVDVQRQTIDAVLMQELVSSAGARDEIDVIDEIIAFFVGEPDNVTLDHLARLKQEAGVTSAAELLDEGVWRNFQSLLEEKSYATQRINSQILFSKSIGDPDGLKPASSFMLLGQRFVIDSYVTGHVVFDEVVPRPGFDTRILPWTLDVLFSLGNDAAAQFLIPEINRYGYGRQLAALRYLIDAYDDSFWRSTIYNGWLDSIRELNPPTNRTGLPPFMRTAAWWQQKMTTQLGAWAQLRHDNLLYAKQSYSGGIICEYPYSYVEPIPSFFERISTLARDISVRFSQFQVEGWATGQVTSFFDNFAAVNDTLAGIAHKEIRGEPISDGEAGFLRRMIRQPNTCGPTIDGWYTTLYFGGPDQSLLPDLVVADIHTAPTDAFGAPVGWVVHVGTGPLDMAFFSADVPGVGPVAFVGPVLSYYEHVSWNYLRLTDEAWQTAYAAEPSFRPDYVNLYLADRQGLSRGPATTLVTGVEPVPEIPEVEGEGLTIAGYPNPFREATVIGFSVPDARGHAEVKVQVFDVAGRLVRNLVSSRLPSGKHTVEWDGGSEDGVEVASGVYVCRVQVGDARKARMVTKLR